MSAFIIAYLGSMVALATFGLFIVICGTSKLENKQGKKNDRL